jgi:hypothetical protein
MTRSWIKSTKHKVNAFILPRTTANSRQNSNTQSQDHKNTQQKSSRKKEAMSQQQRRSPLRKFKIIKQGNLRKRPQR